MFTNDIDIYNWSRLTNKVCLKWNVKSNPEVPYRDLAVFIRIREWQVDAYFPKFLFKWTNTGSVFPSDYTWIFSDPFYHWAIPILIPISKGEGYEIIEIDTPINDKDYSIAAWIGFLDIRSMSDIFYNDWSFINVIQN
jgi:hypothetical protein